MPALSEYSNVSGTAITILRKKGYQVWIDNEAELFCAEKEGWDFMADSPCGLLGVVAIYEFNQPTECTEYWWKEPNADDHRKLPNSPQPYRAVWEKN